MGLQIETRVESKRGCGYRTARDGEVRLYFVGDPFTLRCQRLPYRLDECGVCGGGIGHFRGFKRINPRALFGGESISPTARALRVLLDELTWEELGQGSRLAVRRAEELLSTPTGCASPECSSRCAMNDLGMPEKGFLAWVGKSNYTPDGFLREASERGISKRIRSIPKDWKPGDLVYLAHLEAVMPWHAAWKRPVDVAKALETPMLGEELVEVPNLKPQQGVFAVFAPTGIEAVVSTTNPEELPESARKLAEKHGDLVKFIHVIPEAEPTQAELGENEEE